MEFPIDPLDCQILIALEENQSIRMAARSLDRDPSGINRRINQLAEKYQLVSKRKGRWEVTPRGLRIIE